jgi:2-dehydropantoate 2-reductase
MKIGIIGVGALGGYYGAKLARAGETVHFIARGTTLQALRTRGLTVIRDDETFTLPEVQATSDAREVGQVELALVTTKSYDLEAAAQVLRTVKGSETIVVPLQNGVDSAERLGAFTDPARILGGLTYLPASVSEPGVVRQAGAEKPLLLGPLCDADEDAAQIALLVLRRAKVTVERPADIRAAIWIKFMGAIGTMGIQSVTGRGIGPTREDPDTRALYMGCMREVGAIASKSGVVLPDGVPEQLMSAIDSYPPEVKASMLQDLEQGKPLELEAMHGTVVRLGDALGVPTPVNRFIYAALKFRAGGGLRTKAIS